MSPTPDGEGSPMAEQSVPTSPDAPVSDDAVVISGMSALMPGCRGLDEFNEKLYNMENLVADQKPRWKCNHPEITPFTGTVPELERFDAQFFMIHYWLSQSTDAMSRKLLEQAYQAIIDAGVCPSELSGKRVGVFIATGLSEMQRLMFKFSANGSGLLGGSTSMIANRISYWLNAKGPSYTLEASCCSSLVCLEMAYHAITHGHCDAAIVGGARLLLHPHYFIHYRRLAQLNLDGKTKCYDGNADGQTIVEAITALFLQKHKHARRAYAEICHIKSNYDYGTENNEEFGPYRDPAKLAKFLGGFYEEAGVSPSSVEYVEGFGAAVPEMDKAELQAMEQVFCKDRTKPLLVGSVTSNMGFAGEASGLCGVIKLLLAYQRGELAANLHCDNPRQDILALQDGRMKIVTRHERFGCSFTALNNFSVTGMNAHVLLKGYYKNKDVSLYHCAMPYMLMVSGRQESAVQKILDHFKSNELDPEEIALCHAIHRKRIQKHMARGYGIYGSQNQKTITHCEKTNYFDDARRPLWFVYSGMGSQWAGMGAQLMRIPIFAAAIERCDKVLKPKGVDIVNVITNPDVTIFDNILNSFVGIAAIQIGLTDVLRAVGLVPDHIIGHSVGELGCAYADGCCTPEEIILLSYHRGVISTETKFIRGSMAAVGIGFKQISKICPPEIDVACHNGPDSCTISGPEEDMRKFVAQLTARGVFAKEVNASNIAYHSRYVAKAGAELLRITKEVFKEPKLRSKRWLSTSVEQDRWHDPVAKYSSAEYHTNNMLNPVLFEETSRLVQSGAVLVEVAPHGLLQAILKRSLPADCRNVPLTRRGHPDNVLFLLEALGALYMEGFDIDISALYPKVEFPVSTETRQLSTLVEWVHTEEWSMCLYKTLDRQYAAIYKPIVTIYDEEYKFLEGSIVEGTRLFPLAGSLMFVWDTLSMITGRPIRETSVQFHNVKCYKQPVLNDNQALRLVIMLQRGTGRFEVTHENIMVVEGHIVADRSIIDASSNKTEDVMTLDSSDIYKLLFERGYEYKDDFRSIYSSNNNATKAQIIWRNNWVTFIEGALQLCILRHDHNAISQPQYIKRICIDVNTQLFELRAARNVNDTLLDAEAFEDQCTVRCGGLSIEHISFKDKPLLRQSLMLKTLKFVPFFQDAGDIPTSLYIFMQIVAEYVNKKKLIVLNIDNSNEPSILDQINSMTYGSTIEQIEVIYVQEEDVRQRKKTDAYKKPDVIVMTRATCNVNMLETLCYHYPDSFLISIGVNVQDIYISSLYIRVSAIGKGLSRIELARWKSKPLSAIALTVARPEDLQCLIVSRTNLLPHQKLVIFTSYPPPSDLKVLVKQWRGDIDRNQVYLAMVNDKHKVDMKHLPSFELPYNIFYQNTWGGEYYVPLRKTYTKDRLATLRCRQLGDINSLYWSQISNVDQQPGGVKVQVYYAELNRYDAQRVIARVATKNTQDQGFGMSFSGITDSGQSVMGLMPSSGSVSQQIYASPEYLWPVPTHWSLEDAATVPLAYTIAFHCLGIKSRLVPGTRILIHGGSGAVGQAAISIALGVGCTVFTTVSDGKKKALLRDMFPNLPAEHIGNSRDYTFKDMIMVLTKGKGCDIVFSCLKGMLKQASFACCAKDGTTFDIIQLHTQENYEFGMYDLTASRHYVTIDVSAIFYNQHIEDFKKIQSMLSEGISFGYVRPLSRVSYAPHDAARACRLLAVSRHRGRVLLKMQDFTVDVQPRLSFASDACHVLLCDYDGFGLSLADRLVECGVRHLYLNVPTISKYILFKRKQWENLGAEVRVVTNVPNSIENMRKFLNEAYVLGSVEGIYLVATDAMNSTAEKNMNSIIHIFDVVSRELCTRLRHFTVITRNESIGQNVCSMRKQCNLNSLSIHLRLQNFTDLEANEGKRNTAMMWQTAVEAIESALLGSETFIAVNLIDQPRDVLKEVAKIPGVVITNDTNESATLKEVGIDHSNRAELCSILAETFNVNIPKEIVLYMTVGQLKTLKMQTIEINKEVPGFGGYISYIDGDEMLASTELVYMPTLTHTPNMKPDEYEDNETYLCIVPGIEGNHERFRTMCELLKLPAVVLQLGVEKYRENIQEIAQRLVDVLLKKLKIHNKFYLLGYEFGVLIAIEMASILESYGLTGTVYCLGGTPNEIRANLEHKLHGMTEETLQVSLLHHLHDLILGEKTPGLDTKLRDLAEYSTKLRHCVENLRGRIPHTSQYIQTFMEVTYSRIQLMSHCYTEFHILRAKMIIIRAKMPKMMLMEPWKLSHQDLVIYDLEATLDHAPRDIRCSSLINKYLGSDILTKFNKRNRCESHIVNLELK